MDAQVTGFVSKGSSSHVFTINTADSMESSSLKVSSPGTPWEYYISQQIQQQIQPIMVRSPFLNFSHLPPKQEKFSQPLSMHYFPNSSFFLTNLGDRDLVSLMSSYNKKGGKMDELVLLFYCAELLRIVDALHSIQIIHGDVTPNNLLLSDDTDRKEYKKGGWSKKVN
jgi:checkpoint serine/threonine-protein kinase